MNPTGLPTGEYCLKYCHSRQSPQATLISLSRLCSGMMPACLPPWAETSAQSLLPAWGGKDGPWKSNSLRSRLSLNEPAVLTGATLQEDGAAADLSSSFLLPISLTNAYVEPY